MSDSPSVNVKTCRSKASLSQQQSPDDHKVGDAGKDDDANSRRHHQIARGSKRNGLSLFQPNANCTSWGPSRLVADGLRPLRVSGCPGRSLERNSPPECLNIVFGRGCLAKLV